MRNSAVGLAASDKRRHLLTSSTKRYRGMPAPEVLSQVNKAGAVPDGCKHGRDQAGFCKPSHFAWYLSMSAAIFE